MPYRNGTGMFAIRTSFVGGGRFGEYVIAFRAYVKGESVLLRKPPNLAAFGESKRFGNVAR